MEKTNEQLQTHLLVKEELQKQEEKHDKRYAQKLVEVVLWSILSVAFLALVGYFVRSLLVKPPL